MSPRRVWPLSAGTSRAIAVLAVALAVVTCRDALGPRGTGAGRGQVLFAPILPSETALASFGLAIDQVRIIVVRPATDTLADTTVALPPDSSSLDLDLHVALLSSPETLSVSIIALSGTTPLFQGTSDVEVTSGSGTPKPTPIPVDTYVGPGAGVDSIDIQPAAPFIYVNDSLRFQVQAFQGGVPVTQFYVSWSTSDSGLARVNGFGVLRAPATRSSVRVRARTPGGIADSVLVTFQPVPTQLVLIAGGGQSAIVGQTLGLPLTVEVRAADNLPVAGTAVRFRAPAGGAPADTTVTADALGRASVPAALGSSVGIQTFQINLPAFPAVTLNVGATATSGSISPAQSLITVSSGSVQSGNGVTLTLQGKDGGGNNTTSGGATVVFSFTGGSSTGTIAPSPATDNGNGTYTATFTGVLAGAATTIHATIDGAPVATTLPSVTVTPGVISAATSQVSVSSPTVGAGGTATLTLQARDAAGNALTTGGATVAFTVSGGTSAGTIGSTTDNGNGTYAATFTAVSAGTPSTIGATIGAVTVTSTLPSITVTPGAASPATSVVTVSADTVASGAIVTLRLQAKDPSGNNVTSGGATVLFSRSGGTSTGAISATADSGNGVYTATFTGVIAGTQTIIGATIGGSPLTTVLPTVTVKPGAIAATASVVTASTDTLVSGAIATLKLRAKDAAGNVLTTGGDAVVFTASGGSSTGSIGATADSGTGVYTAAFTGQAAGTATTIRATVNGATVTTALPLVTVTPGTASHLVFTVEPSPSFVGSAIAPAIEVTARDPFGNTTPAFTGAVTVAIGANPGTGALTGTLSHNAVAGVATFNDLQIDQPGIGYTLTAAAGGLTGATSATFDMITAAGSIAWSNPAGGTWSNPANWNGGVVPGPTDIAVITLPGTYTVTFDVSDTIAGLQIGGSSGTQKLVIASRTLGLSAGSQVNANGVIALSAATLNGPGSITNAGQLLVQGATALNGAVATAATSMIRVLGAGALGTGNLTVASGFTNNGTIILTDSTSSYGAVLHVTSGTLTNAAGAVIDVQVGANGTRNLDAQLNNQGTLTVGHPFALTKASAVHANSGTINVNAKLTIQQSGASPSFTNTGSIVIGSTDTLAVTGGTFAYSGGTISGGAWTIGTATVSASLDFSTATSVLSLTNSTWGGSGTLTIAPSTVLTVGAATINAALVNQGALTVHGTSAFNGAVTNAAGATLRVQGNGALGTGNLTVANGFTNNGAIVLTDSTSSYGSLLTITTGVLDNAAGGTIASNVGTLGTRSLNAVLQNAGTLTINHPLTLNKASAAHTNGGTINVGAKFTVLQTGTSPSFTTSGSLSITSGDTVFVSGGTFAYAAGAITGPGALAFNSTTVNLTQGLNTATVPFSFTSTTVGGSGTVTVAASTLLRVRSSTIGTRLVNQGAIDAHGTTSFTDSVTGFTNAAGATLRLQGDGASGTSNLTIGKSFTNSGAIVLTDSTSSYGAVFTMPAGARLTNAPGGTMDAAVGTNGSRTLGVEVDNQGTITLNHPLTINRAGAAHTNTGTIDVSGGDLTLLQTGVTPSFTTGGTITIGAGRTFNVQGGALNYNAGTIGGSGTLAINGASVTATQDFSTATTALTLTTGTWGGAGKLTVAAGTLLRVRSSTINARLLNQGTLDVHGATVFNDSVTNAGAATLRLQGDGASGTSNLTVLNGFTNDGLIVLTDSTSSYGAVLNVTNGTLTNAAGATIRTDTGTAGSRTLNARLDNEGTLAVLRSMTLTKASAAHVNRGTIDVHDKLTIAQSGTTPSFTQLGTLTIGTGDTVAVTSGSFVYDSGTISGGWLTLASVSVSAAHDFSTASTALTMAGTTWGGSGTLTVAPSTALRLAGSTINAPFVNQGAVTVSGTSNLNGSVTNAAGASLRVQGNGANGTGTLTVATGFTNNGAIALTDSTSSYGAVLNVTAGTLANAAGATIRSDTGTGGSRTVNALIDNSGSFIVATDAAQTTTMTKAAAAHQNTGTWSIASGTLSISGAGATFANLAGGTVQGAGIFRLVGIPFTNGGGINPGTAGTGILKVVGNYTQSASGALNVELGGTTVGTQYDRLADSIGTAALNGALNVSLVNGFTPAAGDTFTVLTFPSRSGTIPTLNGLLLGGGVQLDTVWTATSLRLVTTAVSTSHATDITTSETWSASSSPHVVSGYLKIVNGATLTIEDGVTVKFDAGAGLQVGDTALGEAGGLVLSGTPGSIHLTANSGSPAAGFWKGVEVQRALATPPWKNVVIEYAGGARTNPNLNSCVLIANASGAALDLDSLHLRQCAWDGVHVAGGTVHLHRSVIDTTGAVGVRVVSGGQIEVDSSTIRGTTGYGLSIESAAAHLDASSGNSFFGNGIAAKLQATQVAALLDQDTIAGSVGNHAIEVDGGVTDPTVASVMLRRQPRDAGIQYDYIFTGSGLLNVGRTGGGGQELLLDSNMVGGFVTGGGVIIGDSAGTRSGTIRSLGTSAANAPHLTAYNTAAPAAWVGVEIGRLAAADTLRHVRIQYAGDSLPGRTVHRSGLWVRNPAALPLVLDAVEIFSNGSSSSVLNSAGIGVTAQGGGVEIRNSDIETNPGFGIGLSERGFKVTGNLIAGNGFGIGTFGQNATPADSIAGNTITNNGHAVDLSAGALLAFHETALAANNSDTLFLEGGLITLPDTLPQIPGYRWRVRGPISLDNGAVFTIAPDTVVFDSLAGLIVGGTSSAALRVDGAGVAPTFYKVLTVTPGQPRWFGIEFDNITGSDQLTPNVFRKVIVEHAGALLPCTFDCNPIPIAAIRMYDTKSTVNPTFDSLIVRNSASIALDVVRGAAATYLLVQNSQFYQNAYSPMIRSPNPLALRIHASDLYHYRAQIIQTSSAGNDSVDAIDNWWGDVAGLERGFEFSDSLGRGSLWFNAVRFETPAPAPFFPSARGPAVTLVAARDTIVAAGDTVLSIVGQSDSLRVRSVDAQGRGVPGVNVAWAAITGSGNVSPVNVNTDEGGRAGGEWVTGAVAGLHIAEANAIGHLVLFPVNLLPGQTQPATVSWDLDPLFSQGTVSGDLNTVTFTSTNRPALVITHARDAHGNSTQPSGVCFVDFGQGCAFPPYGLVDSLKGDSIFFHTTVMQPPSFALRGLYDFGPGGQDSVIINMNSIAAAVRIDRNVALSPGIVDTLPNPVAFNALCRNGNPAGGPCEREFHAFVVDSGLTPVGNGAASFVWSTPAFPDTAISITLQHGTPANDTVFVQAHEDGVTWLRVIDVVSGRRDSVPILVQQLPLQLVVTPDSARTLIGETAVFTAYAADAGGDTLRGAAIHWRVDPFYAGTLTILDTLTVPNQVTVRLDSVLDGNAQLTAFYAFTAADSFFTYVAVKNPFIASIPAGDPANLAVDPGRNRAYVTDNERSQVTIFDLVAEREAGSVSYGRLAGAVSIAANRRNGNVYVALDSRTMLFIDGSAATPDVLGELHIGLDPSGIAIDSADGRIFVVSQDTASFRYFLHVIDGANFEMMDSVQVPSRAQGIAFNPNGNLLYVVHNNEDSLAVFDVRPGGPPTQIAKLQLGAAAFDVAVNPVTNRVYVTESAAQQVKVINGADNKVTDSVTVGFNVFPLGLDVDPVRNRVYVSRSTFGNVPPGVTIIDGATHAVINFGGIVGAQVPDVAANPVTGRVYAVDPGAQALLILRFTP